MEKLIVIKGEPDAGKSTAMKYVLNMLLYNGARILDAEDCPSLFCWDFKVLVEYKGWKVMMCSDGDMLRTVKRNVEDYKDKCDILIVSSRNYATFDSNFKGYSPIIHQKERYDDYADLADFVRKVMADIIR